MSEMDNLSDKEKEILCAAGRGSGQAQGLIVFTPTIGSAYLLAGNSQWEFPGDNRTASEYEEAIEQLVAKDLARFHPGQGYVLSAAGFRLVDAICET